MRPEPRRLTTGQEVSLLGNPGEWFVVLEVEGDVLSLTRRTGTGSGNFSIGVQAVGAVRPAGPRPDGLAFG